jgi:hypothetical protein
LPVLEMWIEDAEKDVLKGGAAKGEKHGLENIG